MTEKELLDGGVSELKLNRSLSPLSIDHRCHKAGAYSLYFLRLWHSVCDIEGFPPNGDDVHGLF